MRKVLLTIMHLLCVALLLGACEKAKPSTRKGGSNAPFVVDVVKVKTEPFRETIQATGSLVARESVQLQSERSGVVREILFEEGKRAKSGEVLLVIDDSELQAQLARAKARLDLAVAGESRQRSLLETRGISAAEFDQTRADLAVAKAEVALIETQLDKTKIRAPFDGITGLRNASVGTYLTPGTTICSYQDVSALKIDFSLPERYLSYLKTGQPVFFRVAGRSEKFEAKVTAIEPTVDVQTRTLLVRALVPNEEINLLPGSFAEVDIPLTEVPDTVLIPAIALIPGLQQPSVYVHKDGKVELRKVLAGIRTAASVQILEGLKVGDELITSGILQLRPGMKVQVKAVEAPKVAAKTPPTHP